MTWQRMLIEEIKKDKSIDIRFGRTACPGTYSLEAYHHDLNYPISIIYYRFIQNVTTIDILNIHTEEWCRRCGLMSKLFKTLKESYPDMKIVTDAGTVIGKKFMKAVGFKKIKNDAGWELKR